MDLVINGQFTARRMTGQERFAFEIVKNLDRVIDNNDNIELVVPTNATNIPPLHKIKVVKFGKAKGSLWEQLFLAWYLMIKRKRSINLCSIMPILKPDIICIHDISYKVNPQYFKTFYAKISQVWHKMMYHLAKRFSPYILTVSEYSKKQMVDVYGFNPLKIIVVPNGWQHFNEIKPFNGEIEKKYPMIKDKEFFFSLGSLAPNKNIEWIFNVAQLHPQYNFLIAGNAKINSSGKEYSDKKQKNVFILGYISDSEMKCLMKECKAFIFPSFFEGFGIPPLEALSIGTPVIIANTSCLPEIFQDCAHYINPYDSNINLDKVLKSPVQPADQILAKYTYTNAAQIIYKLLMQSQSYK